MEFITSTIISYRENLVLMSFLQEAIDIHTNNFFLVLFINTDLELNCLKNDIIVPVNIVDKNSYIYLAE